MLGLNKVIKKLHVQNKNELCYDYKENDSQEKCYIKKSIAKSYDQSFSYIKKWCNETSGYTIENICSIPQASNVLKFVENQSQVPQCKTKGE